MTLPKECRLALFLSARMAWCEIAQAAARNAKALEDDGHKVPKEGLHSQVGTASSAQPKSHQSQRAASTKRPQPQGGGRQGGGKGRRSCSHSKVEHEVSCKSFPVTLPKECRLALFLSARMAWCEIAQAAARNAKALEDDGHKVPKEGLHSQVGTASSAQPKSHQSQRAASTKRPQPP